MEPNEPASESLEIVTSSSPANPQRRPRKYDGTEPISNPSHEEVAIFDSSSKGQREFPTTVEFAEHLGVTPKTIYQWRKDPNVLLRTEFLLKNRIREANLIIRRELIRIIEGQVEAAVGGNVQAARLCLERVCPESTREMSSLSLEEVVRLTFDPDKDVCPSGLIDSEAPLIFNVTDKQRERLEKAFARAEVINPTRSREETLALICMRFLEQKP